MALLPLFDLLPLESQLRQSQAQQVLDNTVRWTVPDCGLIRWVWHWWALARRVQFAFPPPPNLWHEWLHTEAKVLDGGRAGTDVSISQTEGEAGGEQNDLTRRCAKIDHEANQVMNG